MIFKRIDDENVNCIISESDMQEYDINVDDFLKNSGKAHDFLKTLINRAEEEVDFRASERILSIKMMLLPDNKISIMLSENPETNMNMSDMFEHLKDIAESEQYILDEDSDIESFVDEETFEKALSQKDELSDEEKENIFEEFINNFFGTPNAKSKSKDKKNVDEQKLKKKKSSINGTVKVFGFNSLGDVEKFCLDIPKKVYVKSSLYKNETSGIYYFIMEKSHISTNKFKAICEQAEEFSSGEIVNKNYHLYIREHCKLIIENKAAKILKRTAVSI